MERIVATFSICGVHPASGETGVAVASKFLSVGSVVPWVKAEVGAIATQAWANTAYGPDGLALLAEGLTPQEVIDRLTANDEGAEYRQIGIVDAGGRSASYTGAKCYGWAGGRSGPYYACQGNILVSQHVVDAMADTFDRLIRAAVDRPVPESPDLADMLLAALQAGDAAGGDSRGRQSAALYVARPKGGYGGWNDRYIDLRVDDHAQPGDELQRLLRIFRLYFFNPETQRTIDITPEVAQELQTLLRNAGVDAPETGVYDEATHQALTTLSHTENLEERMVEGPKIDMVVLDYLREKFGNH